MGFCSQFKALFKKNFIVWYRNLSGSLCEILFPVILMLIVVIVRNLVSDEEIGAKSYFEDARFSYYFDKATKIKTQGNIYYPDNSPMWLGLSPAVPFASCLAYDLTAVAFVGDSSITAGLKAELFQTSLLSP